MDKKRHRLYAVLSDVEYRSLRIAHAKVSDKITLEKFIGIIMFKGLNNMPNYEAIVNEIESKK